LKKPRTVLFAANFISTPKWRAPGATPVTTRGGVEQASHVMAAISVRTPRRKARHITVQAVSTLITATTGKLWVQVCHASQTKNTHPRFS